MHLRRLVLLAVGRLSAHSSSLSSIAVLIALAVFVVWSLFFVARTTLLIEAETRYVSFDVSDGGFFTLYIEEGQALLPNGSPIKPRSYPTVVAGQLDLRGTQRVSLQVPNEAPDLVLTFHGSSDAAPPLIGETEIPFDVGVIIGPVARRRMAVLAGEARVTIGDVPRSNNAGFLLLEARLRFEQYVVGLGSIPVFRQDGLRYKELTVLDRRSGRESTARFVVDLFEGPLKVSVEAAAGRNTLAVGVRDLPGETAQRIAPSLIDRLAANPLLALGTAVIAFLLLFGQLVSLFLPSRRNDAD